MALRRTQGSQKVFNYKIHIFAFLVTLWFDYRNFLMCKVFKRLEQ